MDKKPLNTGFKLKSNLKMVFYKLVKNWLPASLYNWLGKVKSGRFLRDGFFRADGLPELASGDIFKDGFHFLFTAPYQVLFKAQTRGIENIICRLIIENCHEGAVCIDVGANYGFITAIMALSVKCSGRVFSFEADPNVFEGLKKNINQNQWEKICKPFLLAVGKSDHSLDESMNKENVERIDLIKIDTDGSDYDILLGASALIDKHHPVLIIEMTNNQKNIYDWVGRNGYSYITDMNGQPIREGEWPPNLIASRYPVFKQ